MVAAWLKKEQEQEDAMKKVVVEVMEDLLATIEVREIFQ
jgi:hypothetical protein